ncbi:MAG: DUF308 domain-containing protein [Muribaculaceae bacterium]|nr:DUF308 domain-containing protein [Muribaculaceae bacterium]
MKPFKTNFIGQSSAWWIVLLVGILMVICGFAYWFWPQIGYAVSSQIFGWLLVLTGVVQLCVGSGPNRGHDWGWWVVGGVLDIFIGFMLVRSIILSEVVFPYFIAFIFIYWGLSAFINSFADRSRRYWWLKLINGILMLVIGFFFLEAGWVQNMMMVSFLTSIAFIYWGFTISMMGCDLRPRE